MGWRAGTPESWVGKMEIGVGSWRTPVNLIRRETPFKNCRPVAKIQNFHEHHRKLRAGDYMLPSSHNLSFVDGRTLPYFDPSLQSNAVQFREKLLINSNAWPVIHQAVPIGNDQANFVSLEGNITAIPCDNIMFAGSPWPSENQVVPAVLVQEHPHGRALNTSPFLDKAVYPAVNRSPGQVSANFTSPKLKPRTQQAESGALRTPNSGTISSNRLRMAGPPESPDALQREIELAAAKTRIAMLENIFFPESFAYLRKEKQQAAKEKSIDKIKEEAAVEDAHQKEEGIQCRMSYDDEALKEKVISNSKHHERAEMLQAPAMPIYPKEMETARVTVSPNQNSGDSTFPNGIQKSIETNSQFCSPRPSARAVFKTIELVRTAAPGRDPTQGAGVGMIFQQTKLTNRMVVSGLTPGGSASLCGMINVGDVMHAIDGIPVAGKSISEVVSMIKGPEGSKVAIDLQDYQSNVRKVALKREPVQGRDAVSGQKAGVGVTIQASKSTKVIVIVSITPNSSAARSGAVFVGDIIHAIDSFPVQGLPIPEVVGKIKGPIGTEIVLHLESTGVDPSGIMISSSPRRMSLEPPASPEPAVHGGGILTEQQMSPKAQPESPDTKERASWVPSPIPDTKRVVMRRRAFAQPSSGAGNGVVLGGVGMSFVVQEGRHVVSQLAPQGAAQASGLIKCGDLILAVNDAPSYGKSVQDLISEIVGPEDTEVCILLQSCPESHHL